MKHRTEFVAVRLTREERARLDALCKKSGLSVSGIIRKLICGARVKARPPEAIRDLYVEINRIGNNINQVARSVNAGIATPEDARQALFLLQKVYELMERLVHD